MIEPPINDEASFVEEREPYMFHLVRKFLEEDERPGPDSDELSNKELYSFFALMILVSAVLALTVGPYSLLR
jgi:hypothetical protein